MGGSCTQEGHAPAVDTGRLRPGGAARGVPSSVCRCPGLMSPQALTERSRSLGSLNSLQGCVVTAGLTGCWRSGGQPRPPPSWEPGLGLTSTNREPDRPPSSPPEPGQRVWENTPCSLRQKFNAKLDLKELESALPSS